MNFNVEKLMPRMKIDDNYYTYQFITKNHEENITKEHLLKLNNKLQHIAWNEVPSLHKHIVDDNFFNDLYNSFDASIYCYQLSELPDYLRCSKFYNIIIYFVVPMYIKDYTPGTKYDDSLVKTVSEEEADNCAEIFFSKISNLYLED